MALTYTSSVLKALSSSFPSKTPLAPDLWRRVTTLGISRVKPTRRGCRGGLSRHRRVIAEGNTTGPYKFWLQISVEGKKTREDAGWHFAPFSLLNIQVNTFRASNTNSRSIPVVLSQNRPRDSNARGRNTSNLATLNWAHEHKKLNEYGVSLLLANTMSLAPKIDEVKCVISDVNPDLPFFTETWLRDTISENHLHIPGYHFTGRNRCTDPHGGIGLYIKNSINFKSLDYLYDPDFETLWTWLRPTRLPRGIS